MKFITLTLSVVAALTVAACGGSSASISTNSSNTLPLQRVDTADIGKVTYERKQDTSLYSVVDHSSRYVRDPGVVESAMLDDVFARTNNERTRHGRTALARDAQLDAYAQRRAEEIVRGYGHDRLDNSVFSSGLTGNDIKGENLGQGYTTAQDAVNAWIASNTHHANMIDSRFTKIGLGVVKVNGRYYWTQVFGGNDVSSFYTLISNGTIHFQGFESLIVDNIAIPLTNSHGLNGTWRDFSENVGGRNYNGMESGYTMVKFGIVKNNGRNSVGAYQTFHQGNTSPNLPVTGRATYKGTAVWVTNNGMGAPNTNLSSSFDADFTAKTIQGSITNRNNPNETVRLTGKIDGYAFRSDIGADVEMYGRFYGDDELAGDFREQPGVGQNRIGAFGAVKQ